MTKRKQMPWMPTQGLIEITVWDITVISNMRGFTNVFVDKDIFKYMPQVVKDSLDSCSLKAELKINDFIKEMIATV